MGYDCAMQILPGLTSTRRERIPDFVADLRASHVRSIALFPTAIERTAREELYRELEAIGGLAIPHVHLRTDMHDDEIAYLTSRFSTEVFNIHPRASAHPYGSVPSRYASRIYVENSEVPPDHEDLRAAAGLCPDYSHIESAKLRSDTDYVDRVLRAANEHPIGCCHISAIRPGEANAYNGGSDHHNFRRLAEFDYVARYADILPTRWISLELENPLAEQIEAAEHIGRLLGGVGKGD